MRNPGNFDGSTEKEDSDAVLRSPKLKMELAVASIGDCGKPHANTSRRVLGILLVCNNEGKIWAIRDSTPYFSVVVHTG